MEDKVDKQVAAPAETRTPNLHRAKIAHQECGWKGGASGDSAERKSCLTKTNHRLDSDRPSHGRQLHQLRIHPFMFLFALQLHSSSSSKLRFFFFFSIPLSLPLSRF